MRSESGRTDPIDGRQRARAASRKDVRDAVKVARAAAGGWAKRTAYNRGQVLYRFAEALESRSEELSGGTNGAAAPSSAPPSTCSSTTRAGRTSSRP